MAATATASPERTPLNTTCATFSSTAAATLAATARTASSPYAPASLAACVAPSASATI